MIYRRSKNLQLSNSSFNCDISVYGGKMISFKKNEKEFLADKTVNPMLFGNTFWPSPQTIWNWPPPKPLDEAKYSVISFNDKLIQLKSKKDKNLGFQFFKKYLYAESYLQIEYIIKNISKEIKTVAPWEVTRVRKGGIAFFPAGDNNVWGSRMDLMKIIEVNGIIWYISEQKQYEDHAKFFNSGSGGWLAYIQDGYLLVKQFEPLVTGTAAPNEDGIEIYAHPYDNYIELENQGSYSTILPGQEINYAVKWYLQKIDVSIPVTAGNMMLVEIVKKMLKLS